MSDLYARYLGVLGLLAECSVHVPDDTRDMIETAMDEAAAHHPLRVRRVLNRIEIEPREDRATPAISTYAAGVIGDARSFAAWWQKRDRPNDADIVRAAEAAGLLLQSQGLLVLTETGKALRETAPAMPPKETE